MSVRPAVRWIAIAALVVLVPIVAHQVWDYIELRRLIAEIDAIRARKEPVTEAEAGLNPRPGPAVQRAGRLYAAAAVLASDPPLQVYSAVQGMHEWLSGAVAAAPAEPASRLRGVLAQSTDALRLADQGAALPFRGFPPGTEYSYRTGDLHSLTRLMAARTISLAMNDEGDAAIQSALVVIAFQRAAGRRPWIAAWGSQDEAPAILSLSSPSAESLLRLQHALEEDERAGGDIEVMLQERARAVEQTWRRYYGIDPRAPRQYDPPMRSVTETALRPWITRETVRGLRIWAGLIEAARTPWPGKVDAAAAMSARRNRERERWWPYQEMPRPGALTTIRFWMRAQSLMPYDVFSLATRPDDLVRNRASRAAIAVERFRRAHAGALPDALSDLVPGYLTSVPQDPVTGGPLLFRKDAASYTVYSVGTDKKDDGGDLSSELLKVIEQGYGQRIIRGADLGVRVVIR